MRRALLSLVIAALLLPIVTIVLLAAARLLGSMQDVAGAAVLDRLALVAGLLWGLDLVLIVLVVAIVTLGPPATPPADFDEPLE